MSEPKKTDASTEPQATETLKEMPFREHFNELRRRMIYIILGLFAGTIACFFFADEIYKWLSLPIYNVLPEDKRSLIFLNPVEPFFVYLKLAFYAGIFASAPFSFYHIWKFIAPGLYAKEKRLILPISIICSIIFIAGALFCYYVVLPLGLSTLMQFSDSAAVPLEAQITMNAYFDLLVKFLIAFGIVFEMPIFFLILGRIGLIRHQSLLKHWRGAFVAFLVIAAILTPPDVVTQVSLAVPMVLLYGISILLVFWVEKKPSVEIVESSPASESVDSK